MASYGTIYECIAYDRLNNSMEIYIQKLDYSGVISKMILDADPIEIKHNRNDRVYGTGAIVNILNDFSDKFLFAKMLADPYETYKLKVVLNGNIHFEGFLSPQTFNQDVRYKSYVALTFGNGLRMLENITPSFLTTGTDDYLTEMAILINIFSYLNLDYTIYINSTLYEDSMSGGEKADNPLKATYLNRLAFQQNDGELDNALTVLNKILTSINADCYIKGERIMIERFVDRDNNPKTLWTYNPVTETHSSTEEAFTDKTLDHIVLAAQSFRYQVDQPIKKLKLKLNVLTFNNIFSNDFDKNIPSSDPVSLYYWIYHFSLISILDTNFSNAFMTRGISFTKAGADWTGFENAFLSYYSLLTNNNDDVVLDLKFKCWKRVPLDYALDFRYIIALKKEGVTGWFYVTSGDTITSDQTELEATIEAKEKAIYDHVISQTMDLSGKLDTESLTGDLTIAIIIYPPEIGTIADPGVRNPRDAIYGDFSLNQSNIRINNLLEVDLNNDAFKTVEEELDLYDTGYINYRTSKILVVSGRYQSTDGWTDGINTSKSLQNHYILNRGNLYNSSCAILNMTVIDPDVEINIDDIFVFNNLEDDLGNPMKFYIDDLSFNVKKHIYTVKLKQWLADVGKVIA